MIKILIVLFSLLSIILISLISLATLPSLLPSYTLAYLAGISMIFLPCTLPLVFVIVPLSLSKDYKKGISTAILFGLGLTITISLYGLSIGFIGSLLGLDWTTRVLFLFAGLIAYIFGLSEIKILKFSLPSFSFQLGFIERLGNYLKPFLLGLLLGNAGIGCPNPAFYTMLIYIASLGSLTTGFFMGFVHGIGRAIPLIFVSLAAIFGYNSINFFKRIKIEKIIGIGLIFIGSFILTFGIFGMNWWESSLFHVGWNDLIKRIAPNLAEAEGHDVAEGVWEGELWQGWLFITSLYLIPSLIYLKKK